VKLPGYVNDCGQQPGRKLFTRLLEIFAVGATFTAFENSAKNGKSMLLMLMPMSSVLVLVIVFMRFRTDGQTLIQSRKAFFLVGLIGAAVSTAALVIFLLHAQRAAHGTTSVDLDEMYPVFSMLGLAMLATFLALFGRRLSRLLLFAVGIITGSAWCLAALAVSP
jgi:hypothetical protein